MNDEFAFIRSLLHHRFTCSKQIEVDVGDDAAVIIPTPNQSLILTCDTMVETVHFLRETMSCQDIGWKLLASNVSDIAAMGGKPTFALCSLSIPAAWKTDEIQKIYQGLYELAAFTHVTLLGGDTVGTPGPLTLSLTLLGEVKQGQALRRSSARPGDIVFVSGTVGDSAAGLHLLLYHSEWQTDYPSLIAAHRRPMPLLELGEWLVQSGYHPACDDISDGLAQEAREIANSSQMKMVIEQEKLPLSEEVLGLANRLGVDPYEWAWAGGEDYQLLGTIHPNGWDELQKVSQDKKWRVTAIGRVEAGESGVDIVQDGERMPLIRKGYNHFANR